MSTPLQHIAAQSDKIKIHVFRLLPHQDLKKAIREFANTHRITAGAMVTCVGSLEQINLRFANQKTITQKKGYYEIVSLSGTFSADSSHIHLAVSDENGQTTGGHLMDDNLVFTTAEIVIVEVQDLEFLRALDNTYGYHELQIKKVKPQ